MSNTKAPESAFAQATGYATDVDAAMAHLAEPHGIIRADVLAHFGHTPSGRMPNMDRIAAEVLSAEVCRLRKRYKMLHTQVAGYLDGKDWEHWMEYNDPEFLPESHNDIAETRPETTGQTN